MHGNDPHLPAEASVRITGVIDVVGRLVGSEGRKIESILDLHGVASYFRLELVQLVGANDAPAPHGNQFARLDHGPSKDGLAAGDVTFLN
jgi:hypothetical protein